jgi:hypothetical protein
MHTYIFKPIAAKSDNSCTQGNEILLTIKFQNKTPNKPLVVAQCEQ